MCGRFVQRYTWDEIQDLYEFPVGPARNLQAHYNVAPTDPVGVVRPSAGGATELVSMRRLNDEAQSLSVLLADWREYQDAPQGSFPEWCYRRNRTHRWWSIVYYDKRKD
jgi:hypothetical protein